MNTEKFASADDNYDWVKVRSNRKHNLGKREWNNQQNIPIKEGQVLLLPRGSSNPGESLDGMKFYFKNGFYEVIDADPLDSSRPSNGVECTECGEMFDTEQGMKQHRTKTHTEEDKNEEEEE